MFGSMPQYPQKPPKWAVVFIIILALALVVVWGTVAYEYVSGSTWRELL